MRRTASPANPLLLWSNLALKSAEMLFASSQVIPMRLGQMALAGPNPSVRDRREFARMAPEKLQAGTESMLAVAARMQTMQMQWMAQAWQQWLRASMGAGMGSMAQWGAASANAARLGSVALAPIHAASTSNARRLARVKRSVGAAKR